MENRKKMAIGKSKNCIIQDMSGRYYDGFKFAEGLENARHLDRGTAIFLAEQISRLADSTRTYCIVYSNPGPDEKKEYEA